jgi:hypothetical protein
MPPTSRNADALAVNSSLDQGWRPSALLPRVAENDRPIGSVAGALSDANHPKTATRFRPQIASPPTCEYPTAYRDTAYALK